MAQKKMGLGKGLGALLSIYDEEVEAEEKVVKSTTEKTETKKAVNKGVEEISVNEVYANPNQPRKNFDEEALNELAASIKTHGIIQPIVVNKNDDGYMIIAGERRWRASKIVGLDTVPCVVKNYTEKQIKEISIIENLQRQDLNPIEAARAIKQLMEEYNFTQETVADRIGLSRPNIANTLRLLTLTPEVIQMVEQNKLTAGHARCLVVITEPKAQLKFAMAACDGKITVRELEKLVKQFQNPKASKNNTPPQQSIELKELINEMQRVFATKVSAIGSDKKGRIYIDYYSRDDLDRIAELLELLKTKTLTLKDLSNFNKRV
ncbi:MAG: ParB/RepB/Spo0J family partition protein [Clostridia bacterium]|nr:ParB/RepB/Spo0J family partition protein [Clostridia bacterium]